MMQYRVTRKYIYHPKGKRHPRVFQMVDDDEKKDGKALKLVSEAASDRLSRSQHPR